MEMFLINVVVFFCNDTLEGDQLKKLILSVTLCEMLGQIRILTDKDSGMFAVVFLFAT